jgi:hypothetical protein
MNFQIKSEGGCYAAVQFSPVATSLESEAGILMMMSIPKGIFAR